MFDIKHGLMIYIISNRKVHKDPSSGEERFSNIGKENAKREFRVASVEIDDSNKVNYKILKDNELMDYIELKDYLTNDQINDNPFGGTAAMFADLYKEMLKVEDKQSDCLFACHGFDNKLEDSLDHIRKLYKIYIEPEDSGIDHLVYLAWPSIGRKAGTYWNDQNDAEETGKVLGALFSKLHLFFLQIFEKEGLKRCSNRIHAAFHSMGATVLDCMLQSIPDSKIFNLFGEILLLNPDVRFDIFERNRSYTKLDEIGSRTHIYISQSDEVLGVISRYTKNLKRRLGHKGPKNFNSIDDQTFVVDTTNAGRGSSIRERWLDHWGYLEREKVIDDIKLVLRGKDEDTFPNRVRKVEKKNYYKIK